MHRRGVATVPGWVPLERGVAVSITDLSQLQDAAPMPVTPGNRQQTTAAFVQLCLDSVREHNVSYAGDRYFDPYQLSAAEEIQSVSIAAIFNKGMARFV
jgi:hypothetical protein